MPRPQRSIAVTVLRVSWRAAGVASGAAIAFPQMNPEAAWHKLRSWIRLNPRLEHMYHKRTRSFTPSEVSLIFSELASPDLSHVALITR